MKLEEVIKLSGLSKKEFAVLVFSGVKNPTHRLKYLLDGKGELTISEQNFIEEFYNKALEIDDAQWERQESPTNIVSIKYHEFTFNWDTFSGIGLLLKNNGEVIENQIIIPVGIKFNELIDLLNIKITNYATEHFN